MNVGFKETENANCDYVALHDVDLIPMNDKLSYAYPKDGPYHVSAPCLHPIYTYETFIGGIFLISRQHFRSVNGMSNRYWGWGVEDDEFGSRLREANLEVQSPSLEEITTGRKDTFYHYHSKVKRFSSIQYFLAFPASILLASLTICLHFLLLYSKFCSGKKGPLVIF